MTTVTATSPSLEERLADAEDELLVAQRAVGHAVLDGVDEQAAKQRVAEIRARVEGLRLAQRRGGVPRNLRLALGLRVCERAFVCT
jgi:glutamine synthetase